MAGGAPAAGGGETSTDHGGTDITSPKTTGVSGHGGAGGLGSGLKNAAGAKPDGQQIDDASTFDRDQTVAKIREQFAVLQNEFKDNPRRLRLVVATAAAFERKIQAMPEQKFSIQEVEALDNMYREQLTYSRELRELERSHLEPSSPRERRSSRTSTRRI